MKSDCTEPGTVLVVDDDQKMLDLLVDLLRQEGYDVISAADGSRALDLLTSVEPDVVISDVVMPVIDGIELCRRLKQNSRTANVPVLLISGIRHADSDTLEGLTAGADDYLDIPFRHEEFLVKVARLAERHRVERHYREIVEQAVDIIYSRDLEGYLTSINDAGARFFGRTVEDLVGTHLSELIGVEAAEKDIADTRAWTTDSPMRSIHSIRDTQGKLRCLEGIISVERDSQGNPLRVRGVVRDITEQKKTEAALKESEERYRRLVELSPEAIVVHSEGKILYVNPAAQKLWGASAPEELIGKSILDVVHRDYRELVKERVRQVGEDGMPSALAEEKFLTLDGRTIDVEVKDMPLTFNGQPAVQDRKSTRLNSSHSRASRMPSSA